MNSAQSGGRERSGLRKGPTPLGAGQVPAVAGAWAGSSGGTPKICEKGVERWVWLMTEGVWEPFGG